MAYLDLLGIWIDGPRRRDLPINTATPIDLPRGTDASIDLTLIDTDGNYVDLDISGSDTLILTVRQTYGLSPLFEVAATKLSTAGRYNFNVVSNLTIDFTGREIYDIWATRAGQQQQVMGPAYLTLTPRMRS